MSNQYKPRIIEEQPETGIERHWREEQERRPNQFIPDPLQSLRQHQFLPSYGIDNACKCPACGNHYLSHRNGCPYQNKWPDNV